jgi:hypothetical protein
VTGVAFNSMDLWAPGPRSALARMGLLRDKKPLGVQYLSRVLGKTLN